MALSSAWRVPPCNNAHFADVSPQPELKGVRKVQIGLPKVDGSGDVKMVPYLITVKAPEDAAALIEVINKNKPPM